MSRIVFLILLLVSNPLWALSNQLSGNASPYLHMHGADPVAWQQWGPEAFEIARRENKLLYVSVGYFACHWCHVMQRESYKNPAIAELINQHYVPIKIDRELLPGIDKRLMDFAQRTRGRGGWPLNIFLTPEGYPLVAVLYEPPLRFKSLLGKLQARWMEDAPALAQLAKNAQVELQAEFDPRADDYDVPTDQQARIAPFIRRAMSRADEVSGGFGDQTKFPSTPQLEALLVLNQLQPREDVSDFLQLTLAQMATQGMRDQISGGFFRYTVDPNWQTPHFEKMLYDNAQLAYVYLLTGEAQDRQIAFNTLDFIERDLKAPGGGYIASLSAVDAQGIEGGNYLWDESSLAQVLNKQEQAMAKAFWGMLGAPANEAGWLPRGQPVGAKLEPVRRKLSQARVGHGAPRDVKVLSAWNGLALRALAKAAALPGGERFKPRSAVLAGLIEGQMWDGKQLRRSLSDDRVKANLADYAHVAEGFLQWHEVTGAESDLAFAEQLVKTAWTLFHNRKGWKLGQDNLLKYGVEKPALEDGALASASAVLLRSAVKLVSLGRLRDMAGEVEQARLAGYATTPFWGISHLRL